MDKTKGNILDWNAFEPFVQNDNQPNSSFAEQRFEMRKCSEFIDSYCNRFFNKFTKICGIRGYARYNKSWIIQYILLYAMSKGLICVHTAMRSMHSTFRW